MMRQLIGGALACCLLLSSTVQADLGVLLRFDNLGVKIHRVVEMSDSQSVFNSAENTIDDSPQAGMVRLIWLDQDGQTLFVSFMADPRVIHSPDHAGSNKDASVGLAEGGWIMNGPDESAMLVVDFPEHALLGLQAETWNLPLELNK